ncbi:MAG: hypothetical protein HOP33_02435 [Verrucomicrobia bacterium]|nr:hypothetical protein [Verrucomicrobiota bacterium]
MANFTGFYNLTTASDLLEKLKWEFNNLINAKTETEYRYHAFNLFVTGFHIADWMHPGNKPLQDALKDKDILKICGHLAHGAKHFQTRDSLKAVRSLGKMNYVEDGYVEFGYFETLYITIDPSEVTGFPSDPISVCDFAKLVIDFWDNKLTVIPKSSP